MRQRASTTFERAMFCTLLEELHQRCGLQAIQVNAATNHISIEGTKPLPLDLPKTLTFWSLAMAHAIEDFEGDEPSAAD